MIRSTLLLVSCLIASLLSGQPLEEQVLGLQDKIATIEAQRQSLLREVEDLKLDMIQRDLKAIGLPSDKYISHSAMMLEYAEDHEQARWVAHIIRPEVIKGTEFRSNDFRPDPLVETGTAVEVDYFLKTLKPDSSYAYDGFGYDRGHLAPSADFRWSAKALSESYYYSNMSPQRPAFNREAWAELEALLRGYIFDHPSTQLYVVTGPVLHDSLPPIERSVNKVSIPEQYFKVALDLQAGQAIGFLMPNKAAKNPLEFYAKTIAEIEALTGLDFFNQLEGESKIEATLDKAHWFPKEKRGEVAPLSAPSLPKNHFNTTQAKNYMGERRTITVCGTVVGSRYSRSGNLWFNLDRKFPNQVFSIFIRKKDLANFSTDPKSLFEGKIIAVKGRVQDFSGVPTMNLNKEEDIRLFEQ